MADLSVPHLAAIEAVLQALRSAPAESSDARTVARALIVLEDASVALLLGLRFGLPLESIVEQHARIVVEERARQRVG